MEINYEDRSDLRISGASSTSGGSYNAVSISGSGKVEGDLDCNDMHTSGFSRINGNVKAVFMSVSGSSKISGDVETETIKTSGSSELEGNLLAKEVKCSGSSEVKGDIKAEYVKVSGIMKAGGNIHADEIKTSGSLKVGGDCEANKFRTSGIFNIDGLLNSDEIDVSVSGNSKVKEMGGEKITIKKSDRGSDFIGKLLSSFIMRFGSVETEIIEGDDIYLEYTTAKIVRGRNIVIGAGCNIDKVEFTESLDILEDAVVKEKNKL